VSTRTWRIGGIAAAILLLVAAWFALISPTLQKASALEAETASQEQASDALRSRISLLKKQSAELPTQEAKLAAIKQRIPATVALPTLIRNLTTIASRARVTVATVTPGRPAPIAVEAPAAPPPEPSAAESESGDEAADSAAAPAAAVPTGPQVQVVSLQVVACGSFAELRSYLRELESMRRVVSVSGLTITHGSCAPGAPDTDLTANITASTFMLPDATSPNASSEGSQG